MIFSPRFFTRCFCTHVKFFVRPAAAAGRPRRDLRRCRNYVGRSIKSTCGCCRSLKLIYPWFSRALVALSPPRADFSSGVYASAAARHRCRTPIMTLRIPKDRGKQNDFPISFIVIFTTNIQEPRHGSICHIHSLCSLTQEPLQTPPLTGN